MRNKDTMKNGDGYSLKYEDLSYDMMIYYILITQL